jgi:carboxyl-terminal processing protease
MSRVMFRGLLGVLLLALVAVWLAGPSAQRPARADQAARADEAKKAPQTYVVLVGISDYDDKQITPRPHAEDDAKALYDLFTNKDYLGADADHVRLLLGKEDAGRHSRPATKENIVKALGWLKDEAKAGDLVLFAFLGEGCSLGERGDRRCYLASDSTLKDRDKNAVAASTIAENLDKLQSHHFCAFLDVNFKGFAKDVKDAIPEAALGDTAYREFLGDDGSDDHGPIPGRLVFLATNGLSTALDLDKHGVFTQVLLDGLTVEDGKVAADKEGDEADGVVTVDELADYYRKTEPAVVREHGKTKEEKEGQGFVLGVSTHFGLTHNPKVAAKVEERLKALARLAEDKKVSADEAAEGKELLARMPKLQALRDLRKEYQKLVDGGSVDKFEEARKAILAKRKLDHSDAVKFAGKVMEAVDMLKTGYVKEVNPGTLVGWAIKGLYKRIEEKLPEDIEDKLGKTKTMSDNELTELLADARERLGRREDLESPKDMDITLQRMMRNLDPYTTYFDAETVRRVGDEIRGSFGGVGIQIRKDAARDMLQVVTPIFRSPAYEAGIQTGDVITRIYREVDSEGKKLDKPEDLPTKGMPLGDVVKKIQGMPGTKVKLTVEREGASKPLEFELKRKKVEVESVLGIKRKANDEWNYFVDEENKIGYVRLTQFARNTARDLKEVMRDLKKQKLRGLVLDLRFNPGGLLDSAVEISDMYTDGVIVGIRQRGKRLEKLDHDWLAALGKVAARGFERYEGFPMVCMVNGLSASGSEIVGACLQDHGRALIVGERSYGKGSVQNIQPFEGGEIKLTTATFHSPLDRTLNKASTKGTDEEEWGVRPDKGYLVPLSLAERDSLMEHQHNSEIIYAKDGKVQPPKSEADFKDRQLEAALKYLRGQIKTIAKDNPKKDD